MHDQNWSDLQGEMGVLCSAARGCSVVRLELERGGAMAARVQELLCCLDLVVAVDGEWSARPSRKEVQAKGGESGAELRQGAGRRECGGCCGEEKD